MADSQQYAHDDPRHHTNKLKGMLNDTAQHAREDGQTHEAGTYPGRLRHGNLYGLPMQVRCRLGYFPAQPARPAFSC